MDFFKIKKFGKGRKTAGGKGGVVDSEDDPNTGNVFPEEERKDSILEGHAEALEAAGEGNGAVEGGEEEEEDEDDDFITNEVKRRLKEMRKNSFMVLIPEEENAEVEEDGEEEEEEGSSSREWVESDVGDGFPLCGFDSLYEKYCQRMLVFDKMILQLMKDPGNRYIQFV